MKRPAATTTTRPSAATATDIKTAWRNSSLAPQLANEAILASVCCNLSDEDVSHIATACPTLKDALPLAQFLGNDKPALLHGHAGTSGLWRILPLDQVAAFRRDTLQLYVTLENNVVLGAREDAVQIQHAVREMLGKQPTPPLADSKPRKIRKVD